MATLQSHQQGHLEGACDMGGWDLLIYQHETDITEACTLTAHCASRPLTKAHRNSAFSAMKAATATQTQLTAMMM